jgi:hypothetical protein
VIYGLTSREECLDMDGILREFEKLENKQINRPLITSVDRITQLLEETKRRIQNGILYDGDAYWQTPETRHHICRY